MRQTPFRTGQEGGGQLNNGYQKLEACDVRRTSIIRVQRREKTIKTEGIRDNCPAARDFSHS